MAARQMPARVGLLLWLAVAVAALTAPARAHHAHGNYALEFTDFEGVVTEVHALNPHSFIYVRRATPAGEQVWALEAQGNDLVRTLQSQGTGLKAGDRIKTRCHALRDGSPGCLLGYIKHPDGIVYDYDRVPVPPIPPPVTTLTDF
jgi:hypothetical protein